MKPLEGITILEFSTMITAALFARERGGEGQHIDLSMLDSVLFFAFPDGFQNHTLLDEHEVQPLLIDNLYRLTRTRDGAITIATGLMNSYLRALLRERQ